MKNFFLLFLSLCSSLSLLAQNTENRKLSGFTKLAIAVPANVHLSKGPFKVVLEGDDLDEVQTIIKGDELVIKRKTEKWSWFGNDRDKITIYVSMPELNGASMSGSGSLVSKDKFTAKHMKLRLSGSGSMEMPVAADRLDAHVSGSGNMRLNNVVAQRMEAHISGSGGVTADGTAEMLQAHISGSGKVKAEELRTQSVEAHISGSGSCYVHADEKIDARISGSGNVQYTGKATNINSRTSGSGKITKRG